MAFHVDYDSIAAAYDRRYLENDYSGVERALTAFAGLCVAPVLEVGCGTGQATVPLAQRGVAIVAVELGERLAALARRRLADFATVEVVRATFEEWEPPDAALFDAVVSFAAFHWIDPQSRYAKAARLLEPSGAIAIFDWQDTRTAKGDDFFTAVKEDYDSVVPEWEYAPPEPPERVPDRVKIFVDESGFFAPAETRDYDWSVRYSAADYVAMLNTQSSYRVLDEEQRSRLFERIRRRITEEHGGAVRREFRGTLAVARLTRRKPNTAGQVP